ncbi:MAG: 4Fe-4S dicluster domain-containing protein, partial [Gemmatimonadetes bacterium]|nr:4Fe-4S dicluster domain-containing protein [Gemmatimonadota bacterium]
AHGDRLLNCVHCGFCLPACPTYRRLGNEADSPRGRLHMMRAVVEGRLDPAAPAFRDHMDRCLGCRACETVCPSGVDYGHLFERARVAVVEVSPPGLMSRLLVTVMGRAGYRAPAMALSRLLRATRLPALGARLLPGWPGFRQVKVGLGMLASTARVPLVARNGSGGASAEQARRGRPQKQATIRVGMLEGCVQEGLYGHVNQATIRVLEANGYQVVPVPKQDCCGAIHAHTGDLEGARELARRNIEAFESSGVEAIVVNAAGCGAIMKEYGELLSEDGEYAERATRIAAMCRDVSEILMERERLSGAPLRLRVTYDAPCHLVHAQGISDPPLQLLREIPELELIALTKADECCGGAGIYGLVQPELGGWIGGDKVDAVVATGAEIVATPNPGCMMQIGAGLRMDGRRVEVVHPIELIDESYRRGGVYDGTGH